MFQLATIDHGKWVPYTPSSVPEGAPAKAMFARRESDGVDWYDHVNAGTNFNPGNVVIAAYWAPGQNSYFTGPATYDPHEIFPQNCIVHEIKNYNGSDPQADLGSKCFDPQTGKFTDPVIPPTPVFGATGLEDRIKYLEQLMGV